MSVSNGIRLFLHEAKLSVSSSTMELLGIRKNNNEKYLQQISIITIWASIFLCSATSASLA